MESETTAYDHIPSEIFCIFKTTMPVPYKIAETPIAVSTDFTEISLSQLINQILTEEIDPESPISHKFEFLINEEFLRGNLKSHIMKHAIFSETNLIVHYCLALNKPKFLQKLKLEDWISSIALINEVEGPIMAGTFNGRIRLYSNDGKLAYGDGEIKGKSLKALKVMPNYIKSEENEDIYSHLIYSGHSDEILRVSFFQFNEKKSQKHPKTFEIIPKILCKGHASSIECIEIHALVHYPILKGFL